MRKDLKLAYIVKNNSHSFETSLMAASKKVGVDRDMLQNAVKVLHESRHLEAKSHRYYSPTFND